MLLELENPVDLKRFRQVCQCWNVIISQITKRKKDIIWGKAESLAALPDQKKMALQRSSPPKYCHHWLIDSVSCMRLEDVDLFSVPAQHLASLASCVTVPVYIANVCGDLVPILSSIKCRHLFIGGQTSLLSEGTLALVEAMKTSVTTVSFTGNVSLGLDIETLTQYNGNGECDLVRWTF